MNNKLLSFFLALILILSSLNLCYAQDPGIPDTVRFEPWGTYVFCPPCSGIAVVPLVIFNDEPLVRLEIPLHWTGPVICDTVKFVGGRLQGFGQMGVWIDREYNDLLLVGSALTLDGAMPPGNGIIAHLYFTVFDTGVASLDKTTMPPGINLSFDDTLSNRFIPQFIKSEFHIVPQNVLPGDIDQSGAIDLADAIFLANYILKGGRPPQFLPAGDVDTDCEITLADIIVLANYYLKGGRSPLPGCAY